MNSMIKALNFLTILFFINQLSFSPLNLWQCQECFYPLVNLKKKVDITPIEEHLKEKHSITLSSPEKNELKLQKSIQYLIKKISVDEFWLLLRDFPNSIDFSPQQQKKKKRKTGKHTCEMHGIYNFCKDDYQDHLAEYHSTSMNNCHFLRKNKPKKHIFSGDYLTDDEPETETD
jgi:hypothetical protein